jgi:hypothetical protein
MNSPDRLPAGFAGLELQGGFRHPFLVAPLHIKLPPDLFGELQRHADAECANPARVPFGDRLAGEVASGEQVRATDSLPAPLKQFLARLGHYYVGRLAAANETRINPHYSVSFVDSWIVLSREGDYNPAHKHGQHLSGIAYLRVPPQVADPRTMDGKLQFLYGTLKEENLDFLGMRRVVPAEGDLYLFPAWLTHLVYPFKGPGDRVSYSFNLRVEGVFGGG